MRSSALRRRSSHTVRARVGGLALGRVEELECRLLLTGSVPVLAAAGISDQQIQLQWTPGDATAHDIIVQRAQGDAPFVNLATLTPGNQSYLDGGLSPIAEFRYRLQQDASDGTAAFSNITSTLTLPSQSVNTVEQLPPSPVETSATPGNIVSDGGRAYFGALDSTGNYNLWTTDGTSAGTMPLMQPAPGIGSTPAMLDVNGTLYFAKGNSIYKSDGTVAGTAMAGSVSVGGAAATPVSMALYHGTVYFLASAFQHGTALCKTDGTASGTAVVATIPGANASADDLLVSGERLYFRVQTNPNTGARQLWSSDGTAAGTTAVTPDFPGAPQPALLNPGDGPLLFSGAAGGAWLTDGTFGNYMDVSSFLPASATRIGGRFYWIEGGSSGFELWSSDGTAAGTGAVIPISPSSSSPSQLYAVGGKLYFSITAQGATQTDVWMSDGTATGTSVVKSFVPMAGVTPVASSFTAAGGQVFFFADEATGGREIWKTDGTSAGTAPIRSFTGTFPSDPGDPRYLTALGNRVLFSADDGTHGRELWISDATAAGTAMVKDIGVKPVPAHPGSLTELNGTLYFTATDSVASGQALSRSLWKSDGTPAGTSVIYQVDSLGVYSALGRLFLLAGNPALPTPLALQTSDGTPGGTQTIQTIPSTGAELFQLIAVLNGKAIFGVYRANQMTIDLWITDGTAAGTHRFAGPDPLFGSARDGLNFSVAGGYLYYLAQPDNTHFHLWRTDGTDTGTTDLGDVTPPSHFSPYGVTGLGDTVVFGTQDTNSGSSTESLWIYDSASSSIIKLGTFAQLYQFRNVNGTVYFAANDGVNGAQAWETDGTPQGTLRVAAVNPLLGTNAPLLSDHGLLYFLNGSVLARTDGTPAGTFAVHTFESMPQSLSDFSIAGADVFFLDSTQLWMTDGTVRGTRMVDAGYGYGPNFRGVEPVAVGNRFYYVPSPVESTDPGQLRFASLAPLDPPSSLFARTLFASSSGTPAVVLFWSDPSPDVSGFIIERSTHGDFSTVDRTFFVPVGTTSYTDSSPTGSPTYYYRVRAENAVGNSAPSNVVNAVFSVIHGTVFNDANQNGVLDSGEAGIPAVTVYVDMNNNGRLDPGEPSTISDASGGYTIGGLLQGPYTVREVAPAGYGQTGPASYSTVVTTRVGQTVSGPSFGNVPFSAVPLDFGYLLTLAQHYSASGTFVTGDVNGDGQVNFADLLLVAQNYGHPLPGAIAPGTSGPAVASGDSFPADLLSTSAHWRKRSFRRAIS